MADTHPTYARARSSPQARWAAENSALAPGVLPGA